ncbi:competence/damage-inducible protein A [Halovivax gelatinilyticus]|uniref:competence/damage-inducible protein A n=1 Tax=Halovivax gelatinilyticus TaxID=2961597 RepID=UPI0020CA4241|nr:molybdopterin-binding protein [Halovivax gelatinilyticus]
MDVAILTVGDELLAGETTNTNASWLAREITDRGGRVRRIVTVPDERTVIERQVRRLGNRYDALIVTGGLGGTPDDVTMDAVASALDRPLRVDDSVRAHQRTNRERLREQRPDFAEKYDLGRHAIERSNVPSGARTITTDEGWAPSVVVDGVYVFPGIPAELRAAFATVADEFGGDVRHRSVHTPVPEGALSDLLEAVRARFDVSVGSYPGTERSPGRIRVTGSDRESIDDAIEWIESNVETVDEPPEGG